MAVEKAHLRIIDGHGEVSEDLTPIPTAEAMLVDEIVMLKRQCASLKGQITKLRKVDARVDEIGEVLEHWRAVCHPRALIPIDGARAKAVKDRLEEGSTVEDLRAAIDYVVEYPYMAEFGVRHCEPGKGRRRNDELTVIFRDEAHVAKLLREAKERESDTAHADYARWLFEACKVRPALKPELAFLAEREPHGSVIARAAVWARRGTTDVR